MNDGAKHQDSTKSEDLVDPRVQIELERLNTATDDINKLEVDLDDARATFRELLCESTIKIDILAKKLGSCIEKSRPYYDARFKAKEALTAAQKAAVKFEKANSQHAAAKEMVYLAEEGLRTEGRSFDHAWQEMLNHATSRVNESEHERAICEVEHRRTTSFYHKSEYQVQNLQKELKRAITKSRPYYETKAQFNQMLEIQKLKVSALEKSVSDAKMTYAEALRNLEKISDEIHRNRRFDAANKSDKKVENSHNHTNTNSTESSGTTGSPDSTDYTSDDSAQLSSERNTSKENNVVPTVNENNTKNISATEPRRYITKDRYRSTTDTKNVMKNHTTASSSQLANSSLISPKESTIKVLSPADVQKESNGHNEEEWTEISLSNTLQNEEYDNDETLSEDQIPYKPLETENGSKNSNNTSSTSNNIKNNRKKLMTQKSLPTMNELNEISLIDQNKTQDLSSPSLKKKTKLDSCLATWISRNNSFSSEISTGSSTNSSRRQSLDMWGSNTGERVKEFLNQGMMMLNISNLTEKRSNEAKLSESEKEEQIERSEISELRGKKVPSPLEKTLNYLNIEDEVSDSESLASNDMLTEDQITSLMNEPDINQVCQEVLGTPLVEVCPMLQHLRQQ